MLGLIISIIVIGLIAGALARLVVPGRQDMSILMTIVLGIIGSFVGGFLGYLLFRKDAGSGFFQPAGIIGSIIGAIIVLLIWTRVGGRRSVAPERLRLLRGTGFRVRGRGSGICPSVRLRACPTGSGREVTFTECDTH